MGELKDELAGAIAVREQQGLRRKAASKEGLYVCQILDGGIGLKGYLAGDVDPRNVGNDSGK